MSLVRGRVPVFAAFVLASLLGLATPASALVLDWDAVAWSDGSLINSYDLNSDTIDDVTVTLTSQQANIWALDPATGAQAPTVNQSLTGGLTPAEDALNLAANLKTQSDLTVHLSFTGTLPGAANVSFTLFDIDVTTNSDIISEIYGVAYDGSHVAATITNVGSSVTLTGTGLNQVLTGNTASADSGPGSSNGNATISFGSTIITDIFFTFSNTAGAPRFQNIAIGDVTFTPVPEMNPAMTAAVSCLAVMILFTLRQRRARRARETVR